MATPRIEVDGRFYRLRETGKATFEPETPSLFLSDAGNGAHPSARLCVCLSIRNRGNAIVGCLDSLAASFGIAHLKWVVGDNGSDDNTAEVAQEWFKRRGDDFIFYSFPHEPDRGKALGRLAVISEPMRGGFHPVAVEIETRQRPHRIESFCLVATEEVAAEAALLIRSLRTFHHEPIFVWCDKATREMIKRQGDPGVEFNEGASPRRLAKLDKLFKERVAVGNDFHRVDCIAAKMDAFDWALSEVGNSLFLDADIVAVANLNEPFFSELSLSPHHHGEDSFLNARKFGIFNAGYLWTNNRGVPDAWREIYLNESTFFEQEGMAQFVGRFSTELFPPSHNIGFWREPDFPEAGFKSFHVHMTDALDGKANDGLRLKYVEHRARVRATLDELGRFDLLAHLDQLP